MWSNIVKPSGEPMSHVFRMIAAGLVMLGFVQVAGAEERIGQIKITSGEVTITRGGETIVAETGAELFEKDVIMTGENSAVGMTFTDNSRMSLGPNSTVALDVYSYQAAGRRDGFDARLERGSLTASSGDIAKSRPLAMRVLMPTTVLGVKGTEFAVRVSGDG